RSATHVARFHRKVPHEFPLEAQVVLIGVRRAQMLIYEIHTAAAAGAATSQSKINILRWRFRRKRIRLASVSERITKGVGAGKQEQISEAEERRLPVKLEVILTLQNSVKDAEPAANTGSPVLERIPGETETRSPVIFVREV